MKQFKLNINTKNQKYPIIVGRGLYNNLPKLLAKNSVSFNKCLIVIDNKIKKKIILRILNKFKKKDKIVYLFKANEKNKNQKNVDKILNILLKNNFQRNDCLISIGGGITGMYPVSPLAFTKEESRSLMFQLHCWLKLTHQLEEKLV